MSSDEEFNPNQENLEEYDTEEWEGSEEQICSELSDLDISNTYKITTGVSTLRKHLNKHQLRAPTKKYQVLTKKGVPFNYDEQKIHDKYLTNWLICDLQPFTVVETHHFKAFLNFFCPNYIIPDRHKAKDFIIDTFTAQRNTVIGELRKITGKFALTADMWTSTINQEAFLGITIHYVDLDWKLQNFLLDIIPFKIRHTGTNIAQEIKRTLEEFNIFDRIIALTTDNESAMIVCGREIALTIEDEISSMTFSHCRCAAHVLNLGVQEGLKLINDSVKKARKLMKSIKNSTRLCDELRLLCDLKNMKYLKPLIDIVTRWNSTFYMLRWLEALEPALVLLVADNRSISIYYPNDDDWIAIKDTLLLLELLERATKYLSASSYPTIGETRFIFSGIQAHLIKYMEKETFTQRDMASSIYRKIRQYWMIMDESSIISAIVDPRNKLTVFPEESRLNALRHIQAIYKIYKEQFTPTNTVQYASNSKRQYFLLLQQENEVDRINEEMFTSTIELEELDHYLQLPVDVGTDPLMWWQAHYNEFPVLCNIARDFLPIQATSVASEQAFSVAGNTITKTRNRLLPETARACLCVKSWMDKGLIE
ncbi:zinc finger BED domain-containing protein RICESLEEPER 2-like [Rhizophagus irregularis DAOM 181602=DAOM 197198]|nr:zinc finger BED domain-containing protein RICESLEEPER 2-like [Rhizophagus irregularis DAOM 181602=DAOM 197198]